MSGPGHDAADALAAIHDAYRARTATSAAWNERASAALVSGVSGSVRHFSPYPISCTHGDGSHTVDLDGNRYIDCFLCGATLLLGHRHPAIMAAYAAVVDAGSIVLNPARATELAEQLQSMIPSAERVRFVNSGTEAVLNALRIARAFTGRPKIVKFAGTYHGMDDQVLVGLDARGTRLGHGIPASAVADTVVADLDDLPALEALLAGGDIAALLIDPSMHHCGLWVASSDHYRAMADLAAAAGTLVIFDEVISGFRLAAGGGQAWFGVTPDLSVFGKALAAGEKLGAIVGRADVMAVCDVSDRRSGPFAFQSGTGSDATFGQASALAATRTYVALDAAGAYTEIADRAHRLADGLEHTFASHGLACHTTRLGPIVRLFLTDGPLDRTGAMRVPHRPIDAFHLALITEGVLTIPGSNDFFLSFAHTDDDIDEIVAAAGRVLDRFDLIALGAPATTHVRPTESAPETP
ncbi:MAG: aminotransferase class III-fold pyridoxal phosphate-dependent enzyme [Ilumatobacteraceae bacterium]